MGLISSFYINGESFFTATAVFADASLITLAADGYYAMDGIVRLLTNGVLGPINPCVDCTHSCGSEVITVIGGQGTYIIDTYTGNDSNALIYAEVATSGGGAAGFSAHTNSGGTYTMMSSSTLGRIDTNVSNEPAYIGYDTGFNALSTLQPSYNYQAGNFEDNLVDVQIHALVGQNSTSPIHHGKVCLPFTTPGDGHIQIKITAPFPNTSFNVKVHCSKLPPYEKVTTNPVSPKATALEACEEAIVTTSGLFMIPVAGDAGLTGEDATIAVHDIVTNVASTIVPMTGYIRTLDERVLQIQDNVVIDIRTCADVIIEDGGA